MLDQSKMVSYVVGMKEPKLARDPNTLAKLIVDLASKEEHETRDVETKNPNAVAFGRLGGFKAE